MLRGKAAEDAPERQDRMFPVQNGPDIPWDVIALFEKQARRQHGGQTLEQLAKRGGLSVCEVLSIIEGGGDYHKYWAGRYRKEDLPKHILQMISTVNRVQREAKGARQDCG